MMKREIAGRSVGAVGLGCMSFGGMYGPSDEETAHACLARALELGVDHWDVAEIYGAGECEAIIGRFLAQQPADVSIATKAGIYRGDRPWRNDPASLRGSLEGSLTRLGRDRVELFYIHRREPEIAIETVMETLMGFKEEGLIGAIGFSEIAPASLRRAASVGTCRCGAIGVFALDTAARIGAIAGLCGTGHHIRCVFPCCARHVERHGARARAV